MRVWEKLMCYRCCRKTGGRNSKVQQIFLGLVCTTALCKRCECNSITCPFTQAKELFIKADLCAAEVLPWGKLSVLCFGLPLSVAARGG